MKQKIVFDVPLNGKKCRAKAMKVAAKTSGLSSVSFEGDEKDKLVVIGDNVDVTCVTSALRKKLCYARIVSVEEVKPESKPDEKPEPEPEPYPSFIYNYPPPYCYPYQFYIN